MTGADWGYSDGEQKAWRIVDVATKHDARAILPPLFRSAARITILERFTLERRGEIVGVHQD